MKCQHCGINFDDSERVCPMCGARAGTRGRVGELEKKAAEWREQQMEDAPAQDRTPNRGRKARPEARRARPSARPIREDKKRGKKSGAKMVIIVFVILFVLLNVLPSLLDAGAELWDNFAYTVEDMIDGDSYDEYEEVRYVPGETYTYDPEHYQFVYAALYDLTGGTANATLADGTTLTLEVEPGEMGGYVLTIQDSGGIFTETGYTWCSYYYPEEQMNDEAFPPEEFDCFSLCLDVEEASYTGGSIPARYAADEYGEHWFDLYYHKDTGLIALVARPDTGIFGEEGYAVFAPQDDQTEAA